MSRVGKDLVVDEFNYGAPLLGDNLFRGALVTLPNDHHEIHCGDSYYVSHTGDLTNGAQVDFLVVAPAQATPTWFDQDNKLWHLKLVVDTEAEAFISLFEAPTYSALGTPLTSFNRNRNSDLVDFLPTYLTPTLTGDGTLLSSRRIGSGKSLGGQAGRENEIILKCGTAYLLRILNATTSNNYYNLELDYYVHPGV